MNQSTETTAAVETAVKSVEKVEKPVSNIIKANSRGYAFFGKFLASKGIDFKSLKKVEFRGQAGTSLQEIVLTGEQDAGNMLRRGYIAVGPNETVEVEASSKGIFITPTVD